MMKKLMLITCLISMTAAVIPASAQRKPMKGRHEITLSVSDGLPLALVNVFESGLTNVLEGSTKGRIEISPMPAIGYRYFLTNRFAIGLDIAYQNHRNYREVTTDYGYDPNTPHLEEIFGYNPYNTALAESHRILLMPSASLSYLQTRYVRLYGTAQLGGILATGDSYNSRSGYIEGGTHLFLPAFQLNPIGLRIGGNRLAATVELGFGFRGFINAGMVVTI